MKKRPGGHARGAERQILSPDHYVRDYCLLLWPHRQTTERKVIVQANFTIVGLKEAGFVGFEKLRSLPKGCRHMPADRGNYVVVRNRATASEFLERSVGGWFKGRDGTVPIETLAEKWLNDSNVLYIGRATNLRRRLDEFARYGRGERIGHRGGRYVWQLADNSELLVAWRLDADPVGAEADLIAAFEAEFGQLPFANLVRGSVVAAA